MTLPSRRPSIPANGHDFSNWFWPHGLLLLSLVVLATPVALWAAFWLRTPWNIAIVAAIGAALWALSRGGNGAVVDATTRRDLRATTWWAFFPLAVLCFGSGIGGWGYQTGDWKKHNAILADLVRFDWPVRYPEAPDAVHLTYYTAFYLPAALAGKVFGWMGALVVHQLGALLVMGLLAAWLSWLVGPRAKWIGVLFAAFGGMDYLASMINVVLNGGHLQLGPLSREWWQKSVPWWGYYAHATELFWVPHTSLAGWLGAAILLRGTSPLSSPQKETSTLPPPSLPPTPVNGWRDVAFDLVACALLPMWSPWAWLGCLPLLGVRLVQQLRSGEGFKKWPWLFVFFVMAMQFGYLMSRLPLPPGVEGGRGHHLTFTAPDFIREMGPRYFLSWFTFSLVEFGFYALLCIVLWRRAKISSSLVPFLAVSVLVLTALPLFQYGLYNDLLRSAVVPLLVVCLACASALRAPSVRFSPALKTVLVIALCIGSLHSVQYAIFFAHKEKADGLLPLPRLDSTPTVYGVYSRDKRPQLLTQYIGPDDSLWSRWFLKP